jgi:hypothetical protein
VCGYKEYPDKIGEIIMTELNHVSSNLTIGINGLFEGTYCEDASWGLESIQIEIK